MKRKNRIFRISLLFSLFIASWVGQWLTHDGTTVEFWNATFENWQSEFLQLGTAIVLLWIVEEMFGEKDKGGDE